MQLGGTCGRSAPLRTYTRARSRWCVDVHVLLELWVRCVRISLREARALPLDVCDVAMGVPRGVKLYLSSYHVHLSRLLYRLFTNSRRTRYVQALGDPLQAAACGRSAVDARTGSHQRQAARTPAGVRAQEDPAHHGSGGFGAGRQRGCGVGACCACRASWCCY